MRSRWHLQLPTLWERNKLLARAPSRLHPTAAANQPPVGISAFRGGPPRSTRLGKPETFNFLGLTFVCGTSRRGRFLIKRKTRRDRMRAKPRELREEMRWRRHHSIPEGHWLRLGCHRLLRIPRSATFELPRWGYAAGAGILRDLLTRTWSLYIIDRPQSWMCPASYAVARRYSEATTIAESNFRNRPRTARLLCQGRPSAIAAGYRRSTKAPWLRDAMKNRPIRTPFGTCCSLLSSLDSCLRLGFQASTMLGAMDNRPTLEPCAAWRT